MNCLLNTTLLSMLGYMTTKFEKLSILPVVFPQSLSCLIILEGFYFIVIILFTVVSNKWNTYIIHVNNFSANIYHFSCIHLFGLLRVYMYMYQITSKSKMQLHFNNYGKIFTKTIDYFIIEPVCVCVCGLLGRMAF